MIVSIYLKEHQYLINSPQTINFGGKYIYSFKEEEKSLIVERTINEKYLNNLFNIRNSKINLLSAIVGQNGVGKSSILDVLRSVFIENPYSMPHHSSVILVEKDGETKILKSNFEKTYLIKEGDKIELETISKYDYQTIYYSPHFDLKYNKDFDEVDKYDISLDNFIKQDLENTDKKGSNENGWKFKLHEELLLNNSMRQLAFFNSNIYKNSDAFREIFNIPNYEEGILHFRDMNLQYKSDNTINFGNTPWDLRPIINLIFQKIKEESRKWNIYRDKLKEKNRDKKQALINQYLLKRFIIKAYLSLIIHQMEKSNFWLDEGKIIPPYNLEGFEQKSALKVFKYFITESKIKKENFCKNIFNAGEVFFLFDQLYKLIEKESDPHKVRNQSIEVNISEISKVFDIHKKVITQLFHYYPKSPDNLIDKPYYTEGFIDFRPTNKNLSSGESALLNFYSKLYDFINNNLVEERKSLPDKQNYILLLDEADLGFHPMWKKKFISTILKSAPLFFKNLKIKPSIQIIITTHDPLSLSDIPNNNVVFLKKNNDFCSVVNDKNKIMRTFGANISNLLSDSFFIEDGLIGDFSKSKIDETIKWINTNKGKSEKERNKETFSKELNYYKKVINLIDERVLKLKLAEMVADLVENNEYYNQIIEDEIKRLENLKK